MVRWDGEAVAAGGARERGFSVEVDGRTVPGLLWLPEAGAGPRPLVLLGHGATRHKRIDYLVALGRRLSSDYGFVVAADPRIRVAVFGLMGLLGPTRDRMAADAATISCPVLFIQQWDDSLIPREHVFELFDAISSGDKRLHAHPGDHAAVPIEEIVFSARFLERHLAPHA